jgi:methyltransferase
MTGWQHACIQLIIIVATARLLEISASLIRLRLRSVEEERQVRAEREPWWPWMVVVHAAVLLGSLLTVVKRANIPPHAVIYASGGVILFTMVLRGWILATLRHRWNVHVVDPGDIVTKGPYRFVRHPNYLAVILEIAALPLAVGAYEVAVLGTIANAVVLSWRIPFEEKVLSRHAAYRDVMMKRPRFFPRLWPARNPAPSVDVEDAPANASRPVL